jgi:hypothetical protein
MNKATQIASGELRTGVSEVTWAAYRCEPPYLGEHEYVRISAASVLGDPETYVFPADSTGVITDYGELDASFKGACDIGRALEEMGYTAE